MADIQKGRRNTLELSIYTVRGLSVVLDSDLATIYGVSTKVLNQAMKRNATRFPEEFAFELNREEWVNLRSQIVTLNKGRGQHRKYPPWMYSEHGALMASTIVKSDKAVAMSVYVIRSFIEIRKVKPVSVAIERLSRPSAPIESGDQGG